MSPTPADPPANPDDTDADGPGDDGAAARRARLAFVWWHALRRFKTYLERGSSPR
jgi:hypothetical protein